MLKKILMLLCCLSCTAVMAAAPTGIFTESNFSALQKDPAALFSKVNSCRLKAMLGKKDYDLFSQSMDLETAQDNDGADFVSIAGNVKGLFTVFEGFFRISKTGQIWIAYLYDNKVHYFTNDAATAKQPPKIIMDWADRFKEAKWDYSTLTIPTDHCKE